MERAPRLSVQSVMAELGGESLRGCWRGGSAFEKTNYDDGGSDGGSGIKRCAIDGVVSVGINEKGV